jgi:hypothetical protein
MSARTVNYASPADVRAFAKENGIPVGSRGLFSESLQKAYNKAHKSRPYKPASFEKKTLVVAKRQGKPPVRRQVSQAKAREWAKANGVPVGARGLVPASTLQAYALSL